ncbi:hypothetical protein AB0D74_49455 [Streptomyces sp. NPDC048278]|uniref:hypothetical protein n=1 Tax=Streptomyces sp. NPDC048278 TaxID=3155809 RepID=UPI00343E9A37
MQGRPWSLPPTERVLLVAVHHRTNLTIRQFGPLCRHPAGDRGRAAGAGHDHVRARLPG